jgi:hypothetical protein
MGMGFLEDWERFLRENWTWFLPMVLSFSAPIIASLVNVVYDYAKLKGWVR